MGDDRVTEVLRLCEEALARQASDRTAYLDEACGGDTVLRRDVGRLLARQSAPAGFLDSPAWTEPRPRLERGTRLGAYEIEDFIGAGGMGEVYKAVDMRLARTVAIKMLPTGLANGSERRARFEREAKTIAGLNHPHICVLHDVGRETPGLRPGEAGGPRGATDDADERGSADGPGNDPGAQSGRRTGEECSTSTARIGSCRRRCFPPREGPARRSRAWPLRCRKRRWGRPTSRRSQG